MKKTILCVILAALSLNSLAGTSFSRPSFRPSTPSFRPSVSAPRPVVINRTTVIQQHSNPPQNVSSGGSWGPLIGVLGGLAVGSFLTKQTQPPAPTIDCSLPANQNVAACQPAK